MKLTHEAREMILRRLSDIEPELCHAEAEVKRLRNRDPMTATVVARGAKLFAEMEGLKQRLRCSERP